MTMSETKLKQAIFDAAYRGLRSQNFQQSVIPLPQEVHRILPARCLYRAGNGLKCAIGHAIKDEFYSAEMETNSVNHDSVRAALAKSFGVTISDGNDVIWNFCATLQQLHDDQRATESMEVRLKTFAERHKLTIPAE